MYLEILKKLAQDSESQVRREVARCENPEVLAMLVTDPSSDVRINIAWNMYAHSETLDILATDPEVDVRVALSYNTSISE